MSRNAAKDGQCTRDAHCTKGKGHAGWCATKGGRSGKNAAQDQGSLLAAAALRRESVRSKPGGRAAAMAELGARRKSSKRSRLEDFEDDEDEDDDDDDDDNDLAGVEEDEEDEEGEEAAPKLSFGRNKRDFYGGHDGSEEDDSDLDEEETAAKLEAQEVKNLQKAHAAKLQLSDFGDLPSAPENGVGRPSDAALVRQLDNELRALPSRLGKKKELQVRKH